MVQTLPLSALLFLVGKKDPANFPLVGGGLIAAGLVYVLIACLIKFIGTNFIKRLFPPVVTGPVIMVIGLSLAPNVLPESSDWHLALTAIMTVIIVSIFTKGFFKLVPILIAIIISYTVAICCGDVNISALSSKIATGPLFIDFSSYSLPKFDLNAIATIAPIAFVGLMEHIGDLKTNGAVVGKDFFENPGLHRTLLGDGVATMFAGFIGGPANTTYSENTGVLAVTKVYDPKILRIAACFAITLGIFNPVSIFLQSIPRAIISGISLFLFGMITSIGMRTLSDSKLDFSNSRNLMIVSLILITGLSGISIQLSDTVQLQGISLAALIGLISNFIFHIALPDNPDDD